MRGKIIDNLVKLVIGTVRAFVDHIGDNLDPSILRFALAENDLRRVTPTADPLHSRLALSLRQLLTGALSLYQAGGQVERDGDARQE